MKAFTLFFLLVFIGCATMQTHSEANTTQTLLLETDIDNAYGMALRTAQQMGWDIKFSDANIHSFGAETPQVMSRWGDDVNVFMEEKEGVVYVTVKSQLGHDSNRTYIAEYLERVKSAVNSSKK